jgi:hypothetical protein
MGRTFVVCLVVFNCCFGLASVTVPYDLSVVQIPGLVCLCFTFLCFSSCGSHFEGFSMLFDIPRFGRLWFSFLVARFTSTLLKVIFVHS